MVWEFLFIWRSVRKFERGGLKEEVELLLR